MKSAHLPSRNRLAPIAVLVFLSPVLTELLMGFLPISNIWLLVPEMGVYGFAALLIRQVTRRLKRGWGTILLLGIAFAIAEECVTLQTSLTPQFFPPTSEMNFGWAYGVEWIYLTAMLWYESVYAIVLPIYLTELLFPEQRDELWLNRRGFAISAVVFLLSSIGVWWLWGHVGVLKYGSSSYQIPALNVGLASIAIAALLSGTLLVRPSRSARKVNRQAWSPWLVGLMAFVHSLVWFVLIFLAFIPATTFPGVSPLIPIGIGLAWIGLGLLVLRYMSSSQGWRDVHRLTLIIGASLAGMLGGVVVVLTAAPIDQIGKLVIDLIAILLCAGLAWRLHERPSQADGYARISNLGCEP